MAKHHILHCRIWSKVKEPRSQETTPEPNWKDRGTRGEIRWPDVDRNPGWKLVVNGCQRYFHRWRMSKEVLYTYVVVICSWEAGTHSILILQNIGHLSQEVASTSMRHFEHHCILTKGCSWVIQTLQERNVGRPGCSHLFTWFFTESLSFPLPFFWEPPLSFIFSLGSLCPFCGGIDGLTPGEARVCYC